VARLADPATSRVVLIGNAYHAHSDIIDLPTVSAGIAALADAFTAPSLGGLSSANCRVVINPRVPSDVTGPVRQAAEEAQDVLLVYFSGHGQRDPRLRGLYLEVGGTEPDDLVSTAVDVERLRDVIVESRARHRILILDCCYSGAALPLMGPGEDDADLHETDGVAILSSGGANFHGNPVDVEGRYTLFTGALIRAVTEGIDNGEPALTIAHVYRHLRDALGQPRINQSGMVDRVGLFRNVKYRGTVEPQQMTIAGAEFKAPRELLAARTWHVFLAILLTVAANTLESHDRDGTRGLGVALCVGLGVVVAGYRLFTSATALRITPNGIAHGHPLGGHQYSWDEVLGIRLRRYRSVLSRHRFDLEVYVEKTEETSVSRTGADGKEEGPKTTQTKTSREWVTICDLGEVDAPAAQVAHALGATAAQRVRTVDEIDDRVKRFPLPVDRLASRLFTVVALAVIAAFTADPFLAVPVWTLAGFLLARLVYERPWRTIGVGADGIEIAGPLRTTTYPWSDIRHVAVLPWRNRLPGRRILYIATRQAPARAPTSPWLWARRDPRIVVRNLPLTVWSTRRLMRTLAHYGGEKWRPNLRALPNAADEPDRAA
jgi:hypothetical protein